MCLPKHMKTGARTPLQSHERSLYCLPDMGSLGRSTYSLIGVKKNCLLKCALFSAKQQEAMSTFPSLSLSPQEVAQRHSLTKPVVSATFKWTPKEVAGKVDSTIYILAGKELKNEVLHEHTICTI